LADVGVAKNVATLGPRPLTPVLTGRPVQLVSVPDVGVPSTGAVNVELPVEYQNEDPVALNSIRPLTGI